MTNFATAALLGAPLIAAGQKQCGNDRCRKWKPLDQFPVSKHSRDGRQNWCRKCMETEGKVTEASTSGVGDKRGTRPDQAATANVAILRLLRTAGRALTAQEILDATELSYDTARAALDRLLTRRLVDRAGTIPRPGGGRGSLLWQLCDEGRDEVDMILARAAVPEDALQTETNRRALQVLLAASEPLTTQDITAVLDTYPRKKVYATLRRLEAYGLVERAGNLRVLKPQGSPHVLWRITSEQRVRAILASEGE